ncbi:MAG: hypothetical protein ACR2HZ_09135, partial [Gemmatimonadaceae bacterium]
RHEAPASLLRWSSGAYVARSDHPALSFMRLSVYLLGVKPSCTHRISQLRAMIAHDIAGPRYASMVDAAEQVKAEVFAVVALTDHVVTPGPAIEFGNLLGDETLELSSDCGHGVFACEAELISNSVPKFLSKP